MSRSTPFLLIATTLLLLLLTSVALADEDAEKKTGEGFYDPYNDPEELKRYLNGEVSVLRQAAALVVVIGLLFTMIGLICGTLCFCLERTCCVGKSLFKGGRMLVFGIWWGIVKFVFCVRFCVCCGRARKKSAHQRSQERKELRKKGQCAERINFSKDAMDDRSAANFCPNRRVSSVNGANISASSPFCAEHTRKMRRRHSTDTVQFEHDKYTWNLRYRASFTKVQKELKSEVKQAEKRVKDRRRGFVYIFKSLADTRHVNEPSPTDDYFYKIGMTTRRAAADRVSEWEDSVFDNREGKGWWRVADALSAEQLIHTLLVNSRYSRFNKDSSKFEVEWFFDSYSNLVPVIERVVNATNSGNFKQLLAPAKQNKTN